MPLRSRLLQSGKAAHARQSQDCADAWAFLLRCVCPLLALSRQIETWAICPLSGAKRATFARSELILAGTGAAADAGLQRGASRWATARTILQTLRLLKGRAGTA